MEITIDNSSSIANKAIMDSNIPEDILILIIKRKGEVLIPNGSTNILPKDVLVIVGDNFDELSNLLSNSNSSLNM